jgi:hypothetical protein
LEYRNIERPISPGFRVFAESSLARHRLVTFAGELFLGNESEALKPIGVSKKESSDMTTNIRSQAETGTRALSSDLSRCVGERGLLKLALEAVLTVDPGALRDARRRSPEFSPQMMLTLLTYCYSAKLYGSRDIEWAIEHDRMVRYICARTYPDWQTLRRFRRQHRDWVHQCLVQVLKQTWALKFDDGEADHAGYEWFESQLLDEIRRAAADRLDFAALMDGAESD